MLLGLDTYSHHHAFGRRGGHHPVQAMDLFAFMDKVVEYGLRGVQIDPLHLPQGDDEYLDVLRDEAGERNLFLGYGIEGVAPESVLEGIRVSRKIKSRTLRATIGFVRFAQGTDLRANIVKTEQHIRASVHALEDADVRLALCSHAALRSDELVSLVETIGSTHVGICLDLGSSLCILEDTIDAAKRLVPFAVTAQIRDYSIVPNASGCTIEGAPLGQGVLPLPELYRIFVEEGTVERLILEVPIDAGRGEKHAVEHEEAAIRSSVDYCRTVLGVGASEPGW